MTFLEAFLGIVFLHNYFHSLCAVFNLFSSYYYIVSTFYMVQSLWTSRLMPPSCSVQGLGHGLFNQAFTSKCFLPITYAAVILILQHNKLPLLPFPNRLLVLWLISLSCTHQCAITGSENMPVLRHLVHAYRSHKKPLPVYTGVCSSGKYPFLPRLACLL